MTALATITQLMPSAQLVRIDQLEPLDEIAGPGRIDGPWLVVALIPTSGFDRIVVLDEAGNEYEVECEPTQLVQLRRA